MNDLLSITTGLAGGLLLGGFFFGGLWWTLRRALASPTAGLWFAASYLVRFAVLAGGLYVLAHGEVTRGLAACAGLIVARLAVAFFGPAARARNVTADGAP